MTNFDEIKRMLDLMDERGLEEIEVEREGFRVRLRKPARGAAEARPAPVAQPPPDAPAPEPPPASGEEPPDDGDDGLALIKSPIVGTFFRAPEPDAPPFVEVGSSVRKGQVLCIIEAMKLMNEIDADQDGEVVKIFVENNQPVQYGDPLFAVRPA